VFIRDFKVVERPPIDVVASFAGSAQDVLCAALMAARVESGRLRALLWPIEVPSFLGVALKIEPGAARWYPGRMVQPFSWVDVSPSEQLIRLEADLEISPLGDTHTVLELRGTITFSPAGFSSLEEDLVLQHLIALTFRAALDQVASILAVPSPTLTAPRHPASGATR
jgi:hypothetical protein